MARRLWRVAVVICDMVIIATGMVAALVCAWHWFMDHPVQPSWLWGALAYASMAHILIEQADRRRRGREEA